MKIGPDYITQAKADLARAGAAVISDFVAPEIVRTMLGQVEPVLGQAYSKLKTHNVYLLDDDDTLPADHPRNAKVTTTSATLAYDLVPQGALRELYVNPAFQQFLCEILGLDGLYPYADPLAGLNVLNYPPGAHIGWHFDGANFVVTLLLRQAQKAGEFLYVPNSRSEADQGYDIVAKLLGGDTRAAVSLQQQAGDLVIFQGRHTIHRVTPVQGPDARVIAVFCYDAEPGKVLHADTRRKFFGRLG